MRQEFLRSAQLLGEESLKKLEQKRVAIFGLGGVGGYVAEALARGGVGAFDLIDGDVISATNINRQIYALNSTVGRFKAEVAADRVKDINSAVKANANVVFFNESTVNAFNFENYDYVVDAIDTVTAKLLLVESCQKVGTPIISCMGTGNKLNPMAFRVADIFQTSVCPLARVMRKELKDRGIKNLKVVYSEEQPVNAVLEEGGRHAPASVSFVPPAAGLLIAAEVIKDLIKA